MYPIFEWGTTTNTLVFALIFTIILAIGLKIRSLIGPSNRPLMVFVFCLRIFLIVVSWSSHIRNNTWTVFVVVLPIIAGLFQLFLQIVSYVLGNKPFYAIRTTLPSSSYWQTIVLIVVASLSTTWLLYLVRGYSMAVKTHTTSIINSNNYFTDYKQYVYLVSLCSLGMFLIINGLATGLKNSSKRMKSRY